MIFADLCWMLPSYLPSCLDWMAWETTNQFGMTWCYVNVYVSAWQWHTLFPAACNRYCTNLILYKTWLCVCVCVQAVFEVSQLYWLVHCEKRRSQSKAQTASPWYAVQGREWLPGFKCGSLFSVSVLSLSPSWTGRVVLDEGQARSGSRWLSVTNQTMHCTLFNHITSYSHFLWWLLTLTLVDFLVKYASLD